MKITSKEIGISGILIISSGFLVGCISALCQHKPTPLKQAPEESNTDKKTTPVIQMKVVSQKKPLEKAKEVNQTVEPVKTVIQKREVIAPEVKQPEIKEIDPQTEVGLEHIDDPEISEQISPALEIFTDDFPLRLGSKGERVFALQKYLLRYHGSNGQVTDFYDQKLADRVLQILKVTSVDKSLFNKLMNRNKRRR